MEIAKNNNGFSLIELILVVLILGILTIVVGASANDNSSPKPNEYVICKDADGAIHQSKGYKITVENNTVIVHKLDGPDDVFANMDCWTERATTRAPSDGK